jgi:hypothetical protein
LEYTLPLLNHTDRDLGLISFRNYSFLAASHGKKKKLFVHKYHIHITKFHVDSNIFFLQFAMYGMSHSIPDRSIVGDFTRFFLDAMYYTPSVQELTLTT